MCIAPPNKDAEIVPLVVPPVIGSINSTERHFVKKRHSTSTQRFLLQRIEKKREETM
jgi:hypothetical protein